MYQVFYNMPMLQPNWRRGRDYKKKKKENTDSLQGKEFLNKAFKTIPFEIIQSDSSNLKFEENSTFNLWDYVKVECSHENISICGRYIKLSRELPQSPWMIDGQRKGETSIQEKIGDRIAQSDIMGTADYKFHAGGWEDIDVRMLGDGWPFILEFENPKKAISCWDWIEEMIPLMTEENLFVKDVWWANPEDFDHLINSEKTKSKLYTAVVWVESPVTEAELKQKLDEVKDIEII